MRTTVTLDSDVEHRLKELMRERDVGFKEALNDSLRRGLGLVPQVDISFPTYDMGAELVDLTHANRLAAALEDEEIVRKLAQGR